MEVVEAVEASVVSGMGARNSGMAEGLPRLRATSLQLRRLRAS